MGYMSVSQAAKKWNVAERTVRNYCAQGKIEGAFLTGKTWNIPEDATNPSEKKITTNKLLNVLREQKEMKLKGGIYHKTQIDLTYNSNHIEGSRLTNDQTRYIFETNTIGMTEEAINIDDIIETTNHFKCIDYIIDNAEVELSEAMMKKLHFILKSNTSDSRKEWFAVGDYKRHANLAGDTPTCAPSLVAKEIKKILTKYNAKETKTVEDIIEFHRDFEAIHPFQDGNGRVGRLIMFKECLANNIVPFIIDEAHKILYYRGLKEWKYERGYLIDTCLACQDIYVAWLKYFGIEQ